MGAAPAPDCRGAPPHGRNPEAAADEIEDDDGVQLMGGGGGDSNWWPPGFRFHPTDEELVLYYLKRKICGRRIKLRMIGDVDVYKWDPWELPEKSLLRSGDKQWYYFSPRDRKYPNGSRSNRASKHGYWKATGKDRTISQSMKAVGNKKTLVYYHGRAPKGERTDWVMHEYTLDEQVLMSCSNVQGCFALYKLFRKSGPGPKNGAQYGAPFREEEWEEDATDDCFKNQTIMEEHTKEHLPIQSVDGALNVDRNALPNYDLENTLLRMSNELDVIPQNSEYYPVNDGARDDDFRNQTNSEGQTEEHLQIHSVDRVLNEDRSTVTDYDLEGILLQMSKELDVIPQHSECSSYVPEVNTEADAVSDILGPPSYRDDVFIQQTGAWCKHGSVMTSLQATPSSSAVYVQPIEMPEVTSVTSFPVQGQVVADEEFLEISDLNDLDCVDWKTDDIDNNNDIPFTGGLIDTDDYFDAQMYLAEAMGPGHGINQYSSWDGFGDNGTHSQTSYMTTELWTQELGFNVSTAAESNTVVMASSAASGLVHANGNQSDLSGVTQGQINNISGASESWFGSALTAFLDSVPSSPAFAAENPLISKALERVSSFRGGQTREAEDPLAPTGSDAITRRRQGNQNGGYFFISLLVGLGAIVWVLTIGATIKVIRGLWGRFISS